MGSARPRSPGRLLIQRQVKDQIMVYEGTVTGDPRFSLSDLEDGEYFIAVEEGIRHYEGIIRIIINFLTRHQIIAFNGQYWICSS